MTSLWFEKEMDIQTNNSKQKITVNKKQCSVNKKQHQQIKSEQHEPYQQLAVISDAFGG